MKFGLGIRGRTANLLATLSHLTLALPLTCLAKVLSTLIRLKFGTLRSERIGHLAINTELYLRERRTKRLASAKTIFFSGKPANEQLFKMIRRRLSVVRSCTLAKLCGAIQRLSPNLDIWDDPPWRPDEHFRYDLLGSVPPQLSFTPTEIKRGQNLLCSMGVPREGTYVCIHARDRAYLDRKHPYRSRKEWSYHDYRDSSIENYQLAAEYIAGQEGNWVFRMGSVVEQAFESSCDRVIDYARRYRSDFGDIYLSATCRFFVTSDGGLGAIPWISNIPVAYVNSSPPLGRAGWREPDIYIPKKVYSVPEKRILSFMEILEIGVDRFTRTEDFKLAGLVLIENSPNEILDVAVEMDRRLGGVWVESKEDIVLRRQFEALFEPHHRVYTSPSRIGTRFLRQNRQLLVPC